VSSGGVGINKRASKQGGRAARRGGVSLNSQGRQAGRPTGVAGACAWLGLADVMRCNRVAEGQPDAGDPSRTGTYRDTGLHATQLINPDMPCGSFKLTHTSHMASSASKLRPWRVNDEVGFVYY
jgi:hypothetical protein